MANDTQNSRDDGDHTVVVVGGHGGMSSRYRDVAKKLGWSVKHYEQRIPRVCATASARSASWW